MDGYPLIADHGLVGDLQTAALVSTDGTLDWFCSPRFDSPSIFASLLDTQRGGFFRIRPAEDGYSSKQLYFPDTAILITRFMTDTGVGEVVDFMPPLSGPATDTHRFVRMIRCVRGHVAFDVEVRPRFDYGRSPHTVQVNDVGAVFSSAAGGLTLHVVREPADAQLALLDRGAANDVALRLPLEAGQIRGAVLETGRDVVARKIRAAEIEETFAETVRFWRSWLAQSTYRGRWREPLARAAITLKLMTYEPSGALVAAPTAGLPEQIGGERNWDYRYTWVRDSSFSVYALLGLGFTQEAAAFARWLGERVREHQVGDSGPLRIMYRVDGSSDLTEEVLGHLEGYRGSAPVRIGNGASDQLQLDIYGEALDSIAFADRHGLQIPYDGWVAIRDILNWLVDNWDSTDEGIWETRGGRKDFTYGRLMSWVAFDRAVRLATAHGRPGPVDDWRRQRDAVYEQVMRRGWHPERRAFVQHYDTDVLDASLLRMPSVGFVAPRDPRWLSTLDAMDTELVTDSLVYRYNPEASPDGLRGSEGTFSLCTFDYVRALTGAGRLDDARLTFEKMLTYANHLGLYSEEVGLDGEQLGNFPQAFTHLALIDAAINLDRALDAAPPVSAGAPARAVPMQRTPVPAEQGTPTVTG
jgi:GH15 family glucan-1,4-alpha-glucosidase